MKFCPISYPRLALLTALFCLSIEVMFPHVALAQNLPAQSPADSVATSPLATPPQPATRFPEANLRQPRYTMRVVTTAYSSTPDQTDDTPFTTANGSQVYDGVAAANFLPFGTQVRLPDYFGDKVFTIEDRMNERYDVRLDIWMTTREAAKRWGVRSVRLEIL